ncbi:MAG: sigma-54-dependent Fis family transcriptional regulator [Acidobacteria bacterium]|nr:sigma-54-dependent Fis family transcriptional regulator [Acidobacteriota bacterium]
MSQGTLLIVDDEPGMRESLVDHFAARGFRVLAAATGNEALTLSAANLVDVMLLDHRLPDMSGLDVLKTLRSRDDDPEVVMVTAFADVETAVAAMKAGATDFILKPFDLGDLARVVTRAAERRRLQREIEAVRRSGTGVELVGVSAATEHLRRLIARIAVADRTTVLVTGQTGTGKELVVDALHRQSPRAQRPLVKANCGAFPESLLEAELFGHERGAFTGAASRRHGLLELAIGGTLFLDEVAEIPLSLQPALLRVLDGAPFRRVGGEQEIRTDIRFVAATNRDLAAEVRAGRVREDLYHRLAVVRIDVPPLRERPDDIDPLSTYFLKEFSRRLSRHVALSRGAQEALLAYWWPGNVRELRNVLERAAILADGDLIEVTDLPPEITESKGDAADAEGEALEAAKHRHILSILAACGGNRAETARRLGISRSTLKEHLRRHRTIQAH